MATWQCSTEEYDRQLWIKVKDKCERETKRLASDSGISPAQAARYMTEDSLGDILEKSRNKLLGYIGYRSFDAFRTAIDKELETATDAPDSNTGVAPFHSVYHINMPAKPELFLGRLPLLQEIHKRLTNRSQRDNVLLLTSMGGMGKTTLLHEYLNRDYCRKHFKWIVSVSVHKNLESIFIQSMAAALQVDLSVVFAQEKRLEMVIQAMQQQEGDNLVAIDNINESDYGDLVKMYRHFRRTGWKILITTRTSPDEMESIDVGELDMEDAMLLFLNYYVPDTLAGDDASLVQYMHEQRLKTDLEKLLAHIRCHTLFTELLAKTGRKNRATPGTLLKHLEQEDLRHTGLARTVSTGAHAYHTGNALSAATLHQYMLSIFDTEHLQLHMEDAALNAENNARITMLQFFSVLPSTEIPINQLKKLWRVEDGQANEFEDRLDILRQTGWIKAAQSSGQTLTYKMHPLVQEVVYEKLKPNARTCAPLVKTLTEMMQGRRSELKGMQPVYQEYFAASLRKLQWLTLSKK